MFILKVILFSLATIFCYQLFALLQKKTNSIYLNPMLLSVFALIAALIFFEIPYQEYATHTQVLSELLEPAVVALGFPLYQHLDTVKKQWKSISLLLFIAVIIALAISFIVSILIITLPDIAVSLALKSITTPIGLTLTEQLNGNAAVTAFSIIIAGLVGATIGTKWLNFINVTSPIAQGLAIGTASHALGTATISKISYQHAAYGSFSLIASATMTAVISPLLIPFSLSLFT